MRKTNGKQSWCKLGLRLGVGLVPAEFALQKGVFLLLYLNLSIIGISVCYAADTLSLYFRGGTYLFLLPKLTCPYVYVFVPKARRETTGLLPSFAFQY